MLNQACCRQNGETWQLREPRGVEELDAAQRESVERATSVQVDESSTPAGTQPQPQRKETKVVRSQWDFSPDIWGQGSDHRSSTLCSVEDLVHSLDTGENPRGGEHGSVPRGNIELIFGFVESHMRGGETVKFPMEGHGRFRMERRGVDGTKHSLHGQGGLKGNDPKFARTAEELALAAEQEAALEVVEARL